MAQTKTPAKFYSPLAIGAPAPFRERPVRLERMIHFVPPQNEKIRAKIPELIGQVDVILGNLEDAIPAGRQGSGAARLHRDGAGQRFRRHRPVDAHQLR